MDVRVSLPIYRPDLHLEVDHFSIDSIGTLRVYGEPELEIAAYAQGHWTSIVPVEEIDPCVMNARFSVATEPEETGT